MLEDLLVKINVDMQPLVAAAPSIDAKLGAIQTGINRVNSNSIVVMPQQAVSGLDAISTGAELVEHTMHSAAFAAELTAGSLSRLGAAATTLGAGFAVLDRSATVATGSLTTVATTAGYAAPAVTQLATVTHTAANGLRTLANSARIVGATAGVLSSGTRAAAGGILHMVHSIHAAQIVVDLLSTAVKILMVPLRIIGSVAAVVFRGMVVALNTVLLPVKWLWSGLMAIARVSLSLISALSSVAIAVFKVWFIFKGWVGAIRVIFQWLGMLPPKLRILVGGLLLLGAAGKAGAFALNVVAKAARVAVFAFQALMLPVMLLTNPLMALRSAAMLAGQALLASGRMAMRAAAGFWSLAKATGSAVGSVVGNIAGRLVGAAKSGIMVFGALGAAAAAWGIKMAVKAEQSTVVFGTMLKDMRSGKALMNELENWSGAPLFDPEEIQLSGTLLFKAGVAAQDITGKLDQLGNIAAATKTPIEDLAQVFQQGVVRGKFGLDLIKQMGDNGIAIYEGLTHATGKSGAALADMISAGKIGAAEMNAALAHLTTGTGIYAGAMTNLSQTTGGMWSGMMNKAGLAAREFDENILNAIDAKGLMTQATEFFTSLRTQIANAMPAFTAIATVVKAGFAAVWEVVTVTFSAITGALGLTGDNWMTTFLEWSAIATWAFEQWPDIATLAFTNVALSLVQFTNDFTHIFTGVMPALFSWFGSNWADLFTTAASFVGSVFTNIATNIFAVMKGVWDFIASGGTKSFSVAWTPMLDGFKNTVKELPDIPTRAVTDLERQLQADSERLGDSLGNSLAEKIDANMQMLDKFKADQAAYVAPTLDGAHGPDTSTGSDTGAEDKGKGNKRTSFAVDSLDRGSEAALKAIFASSQQDRAAQQQVNEQKTTNKLLTKLVAKSDGPKLASQGAV